MCVIFFTYFSPSLLECILPPWNIALVVMGALALLFALVGSIETIIDGIYVCQRLPEKGELYHSSKPSLYTGICYRHIAILHFDSEILLLQRHHLDSLTKESSNWPC